jgi:predicted nucleotidyltransferase
MRLTSQEVQAIKQCTQQVFGVSSRVLLFGSRVDDQAVGGDIDLYIIPQAQDNLLMKKLDFLVGLKLDIGDQKIDVVLAEDPNRLIEQEALRTGIEL